MSDGACWRAERILSCPMNDGRALNRFRSSTNTSAGPAPTSWSCATNAKAAMITKSPTAALRAADPLSETMPLPRGARNA